MGRNFATMAPVKISSVEPRPWLPCWASRGIAYPQPAVSAGGRCQRLRVAPIVLASMESTKKEIETKATKAGVIWFVDEDEVVQRILEVISRDEIAMAVTYQEAKEHDTFKAGRATKRRRKDGPPSKAPSSST